MGGRGAVVRTRTPPPPPPCPTVSSRRITSPCLVKMCWTEQQSTNTTLRGAPPGISCNDVITHTLSLAGPNHRHAANSKVIQSAWHGHVSLDIVSLFTDVTSFERPASPKRGICLLSS